MPVTVSAARGNTMTEACPQPVSLWQSRHWHWKPRIGAAAIWYRIFPQAQRPEYIVMRTSLPGNGPDTPPSSHLRGVCGFCRAPPQKFLLAFVAGEACRRLERRAGLLKPPQSLQEIAAHARQQMIGFQRRLVRETLHDRKRHLRAVGHADRYRAIEFDHRRTHQGRKLGVKLCDARPWRLIRCDCLGMTGDDRRLQRVEAAGAAE